MKTKLGPSKIHGVGLFAEEFIPKGTITWRFMPGFDLRIDPQEVNKLPDPAKESFWNYCYLDKFNSHLILCFDNERFINHSNNPNIIQNRDGNYIEGREVAGRDIAVGEEMTVNYFDFDKDAERKLGLK